MGFRVSWRARLNFPVQFQKTCRHLSISRAANKASIWLLFLQPVFSELKWFVFAFGMILYLWADRQCTKSAGAARCAGSLPSEFALLAAAATGSWIKSRVNRAFTSFCTWLRIFLTRRRPRLPAWAVFARAKLHFAVCRTDLVSEIFFENSLPWF